MRIKITSKENFAWPAFGIDLRANGEETSVFADMVDDRLIPSIKGWADLGKLTLEEVNSQGEVLRVYIPKLGDFGPTDKTKLDPEDESAAGPLLESLAQQERDLAKRRAELDAERAKFDADRAAFAAASKPAEGSSESSSTGAAEGQPSTSSGRRAGGQRGGSGG